MNELVEALNLQLGQLQPKPDIANVRHRIARRRRRTHNARAIAGAVAAVATVTLFVATARWRDARTIAVQSAPAPASVRSLGGLVIGGAGADNSYRHASLERSDAHTDEGPHAIVVRPADGVLGAASAVVSYPVPSDVDGDSSVRADTSRGNDLLSLVVARPGGRVLIRAVSLDEADVMSIARSVAVVGGRPVLVASGPATRFRVASVGTLRPQIVREARYGCDALGEGSVLGALCYTGLTTSLGFENALYGSQFQPGPTVHGQPSVVSAVGGGNATLAWEPEPGVIAFVGYSGYDLGPSQIDALARLAERAVITSPAEWSASAP
jgi:hypothetical protein